MNLQKKQRIHFVGIGGISMSALAAILKHKGHIITGSDLTANDQTHMLTKMGIKVCIGHSADNLNGCDLLVITNAIAEDNAELQAAKAQNIEITTRENLLAEIESTFSTRIAVAGTHGKSTTTAMIYAILNTAKLNPTLHNGAVVNEIGRNYVIGSEKIFLTEACEFKRSLLTLSPTIAVITNVDEDHMDCYKDIEDIKNTFAAFAAKAEAVIKNADCPNSKALTAKNKTIEFGLNNGAVHAAEIKEYIKGKYSFNLVQKNKILCQVKLTVPGMHNVYNALAAASVGRHLGIKPKKIAQALSQYTGIARRFEKLAEIKCTAAVNLPTVSDSSKLSKKNNTSNQTFANLNACHLITDYAHHPAEIATTIKTAKSLYNNFLIIFQPHTYTRTIALFDQFISVLSDCNCVMFKTYAAREKVIPGGTAKDLANALSVKYIATPIVLKNFIQKNACKYDAIILTGAGNMNDYVKF